MNYRKYELFDSVRILILIGVVVVFLLLSFLIRSSIKVYDSISAYVINNKEVMALVSDDQLAFLKHNTFLLVDGKKRSFLLRDTISKVLKRDGVWYHQVVIEVHLSSKYQYYDSVILNCYRKDISFIESFYQIWKGV